MAKKKITAILVTLFRSKFYIGGVRGWGLLCMYMYRCVCVCV